MAQQETIYVDDEEGNQVPVDNPSFECNTNRRVSDEKNEVGKMIIQRMCLYVHVLQRDHKQSQMILWSGSQLW